VKTPATTGSAGKTKKGGAVPGALQRQGTFTKDEPSSSIPLPVKKTVASPLKKNPTSRYLPYTLTWSLRFSFFETPQNKLSGILFSMRDN
jgi:hypothetical protein